MNNYSKICQLIYLFLLLPYCEAMYSHSKHVVELTSENFDQLVVKSDEVWIVEFYAPWCVYCQNLVPEYIKTANALRGIIKVGAVDVDIHKELPGRYGIRGLPTIKIFGVDKFQPNDFIEAKNSKQLIEVGLRTARAKILSRLSLKEQDSFWESDIDDEDIVELTDSNFDELVLYSKDIWMIEFYANWCGHCKTLEPHWKSAAKALKGNVKFGKLDGSINKKKTMDYDVTAYPTIKLFKPLTKDFPIDYNGGRRANDIIEWVTEKLGEGTGKQLQIHEILCEASLRAACEEREYCILTFFPNLLDCQAFCRNAYINMLQKLAYKFKNHEWGWVWSEAGAQPEIENALDIHRYGGYPSMAAINYEKGIFILQGAFVEEEIYNFLNNLSRGVGRKVNAINEDIVPKIFVVEPWDGTDRILEEKVYPRKDEDDKDEL